jgi:hypothetical protein
LIAAVAGAEVTGSALALVEVLGMAVVTAMLVTSVVVMGVLVAEVVVAGVVVLVSVVVLVTEMAVPVTDVLDARVPVVVAGSWREVKVEVASDSAEAVSRKTIDAASVELVFASFVALMSIAVLFSTSSECLERLERLEALDCLDVLEWWDLLEWLCFWCTPGVRSPRDSHDQSSPSTVLEESHTSPRHPA